MALNLVTFQKFNFSRDLGFRFSIRRETEKEKAKAIITPTESLKSRLRPKTSAFAASPLYFNFWIADIYLLIFLMRRKAFYKVTRSWALKKFMTGWSNCPCRYCSAPDASGGDRYGSSRRIDRVESAEYHLIGYPSAIGTLDICFGKIF